MNLVSIDLEFANAIPGSICAFGFAFETGCQESGVIRLHPSAGVQERTRWHRITTEQTIAGMDPAELYLRLESLPEDTILVAHDARIDRMALNAWYTLWDFPPLEFMWIDSLGIARRLYGKNGKTGIAAMAVKLGVDVTPHDPADDALVALLLAQSGMDVAVVHDSLGRQMRGVL